MRVTVDEITTMEQAKETQDEVLARVLLEWSRLRSSLLRHWTFQAIADNETVGPNLLEELDLGAQIKAYEEIFSQYPALASNRVLVQARDKAASDYRVICEDNRLRRAINTGDAPPGSYPPGRITDSQKRLRRPRVFNLPKRNSV